MLGTTVAVDELKSHLSLLRDLNSWYRNFVQHQRIGTLIFHEMKPIPPVGLVVEPWRCWTREFHASPVSIPLDEDHRTIVQAEVEASQKSTRRPSASYGECLDFYGAHRVGPGSGTRWAGQPFDPAHPWNVPYPQNRFFTGRDKVVTAIRRQFTGRRKAALAQAISGLGGIGKTQTAVEYAYRYCDKYQAVLWLNAESPLTLKADFGELARLMQLPQPGNDLDQAVVCL